VDPPELYGIAPALDDGVMRHEQRAGRRAGAASARVAIPCNPIEMVGGACRGPDCWRAAGSAAVDQGAPDMTILNYVLFDKVIHAYEKKGQFQAPAITHVPGVSPEAAIRMHGVGYAKLTPRVVYVLLEQRTRPAYRSKAQDLLRAMGKKGWAIVSTFKQGGLGGKHGGVDMRLHATLQVGRQRRHLRVQRRRQGDLVVIDIT